MKRYLTFLIAIFLLTTHVLAQTTITGATKVASGGSFCYSVTSVCATKTYCWSATNASSVTPESSCGGGPAVVAATATPNSAPGGGSNCTSPAMALVVFPTVTTTTTSTIVATSYCGIQGSLPVTIVPPPGKPTVSPASQSVACSSTATALTTSTATGGDGTYSYQWYSSSDNSTWTIVSGATASSYTPGVPAAGVTVYYQVRLTSFQMVSSSASVTITGTAPALVPGTITPNNQAILSGTTPATLQGTIASGGGCSGSYTYTWYSSTDGTTFSSIGVTTQNYSPGSLTSTTYYKRLTAVTGGGSAYSNIDTVVVYQPLTGGSIAGPSSLINYNTTASLTDAVHPTGGNCGSAYIYQWWSSVDGGSSWQQVTGASLATLATNPITVTTQFYRTTTCGALTVNSNIVSVQPAPALVAGSLTPSYQMISSGSVPGPLTAGLASGGNCNGAYSFTWQSSADSITWTSISDTSRRKYKPGATTVKTYVRLAVTCNGQTVYSSMATIAVGNISTDLNYIRTRAISRPGIGDYAGASGLTSPYDVQQKTQYMDGLGRPVQTVSRQVTPAGNDLVQTQDYDPFGREANRFLPFATARNDGNYKPGAYNSIDSFNTIQYPDEQYYYGKVVYESSPVNRTLMTYPQGINWIGNGRGVANDYQVNLSTDSVAIWNVDTAWGSIPVMSGFYPAGMLYKNVSIDENGHQTIEYKNKQGQPVLKKSQLADFPGTAHSGWLCTYFVYDNIYDLRYILPPAVVGMINTGSSWNLTKAIVDQLCFHYEYDLRNRVILKRTPGAGEIHTVYDERDRVVMFQDSLLRAQHKWLFTCYDGLNRPDSTGLMTDPTNYGNLAWHTAKAATSVTYPVLSDYTIELLSQTYYDSYSSISSSSSLPSGMATVNNTNWISSYNVFPVYAVQPVAYSINWGMKTGMRTKVLGTATQFLYSESFYDDRGRAIQTRSVNYTGGIDTSTTQYDFSGKTLRLIESVNKLNNGSQGHQSVTKNSFDAAFRLVSVTKNIDGGPDQQIDSISYDELGRQRQKILGGGLDSVVSDYGIRGWLTGLNKNFVAGKSSHFFGLELNYDKLASASGTSYANAQYSGNITGLIWKSAGDNVDRKYDFTYDDNNRLTAAAYLDNSSGSGWDKSKMDYSVSNLSYDLNGNILSMNQAGFKIGAPTGLIDQLTYTYQTGSNQLSQVVDAVNDSSSKLGDFHYSGNKQAFDYKYDGNGNLEIDNNKAIDSISYNFLNQPQVVHMKGEGNIAYTYDASGNRLQKQSFDSSAGIATTTLYLDEYQYQRRTPLASPSSGTDTLQFVQHEEGRTRWAFHRYTSGDSAYKWEYDFYEKDHLGNNRILLTRQKDTALYIATMEAAYRSKERALYYNIDSTSYASSLVPGGYPADNTTTPNDSVARVNGNGHKMGPAILLKVMSGDSIVIGVKSFYRSGGTVSSPQSSLPSVLASLAQGLVSIATGTKGSLADLNNTTGSPVYAALNSFLPTSDTGTTSRPKAYLNWMLLNNQLGYVSGNGQSGAIPVGSPDILNTLAQTIGIKNSGYLYVWVSNETPNWDVFFDNLSLKTISGPLLEETHYYPFGLTMAGISDKALKTKYVGSQYRFGGKELQSQEFSDGAGLDEYDYTARFYNPQIGKWLGVDPKAEQFNAVSPYQFCMNNPFLYIDPTGKENVIYLVGLQGVSNATMKTIMNKVNDNFQKLGLKTRAVIFAGKDFNKDMYSKMDKHDAVAVIGNTADVIKTVSALDPKMGDFLKKDPDFGPQGGVNPEISGNPRGVVNSNDNIIAVNTEDATKQPGIIGGSYTDGIAWNVVHGAGHNSSLSHEGTTAPEYNDDRKVPDRSVMSSGPYVQNHTYPLQSYIETPFNQGVVTDHYANRFGGQTAKPNKNIPVKQ